LDNGSFISQQPSYGQPRKCTARQKNHRPRAGKAFDVDNHAIEPAVVDVVSQTT
jgi:hypothetical protein